MDLEIYNAEDRLFSSHALTIHMTCFSLISNMLYDLSHYNVTNFHITTRKIDITDGQNQLVMVKTFR